MTTYKEAYERLRAAAERVIRYTHTGALVNVVHLLRAALAESPAETTADPLSECPDGESCPDPMSHKIEAVLRERLVANFRNHTVDAKYLRLIADVVQYEMGGSVGAVGEHEETPRETFDPVVVRALLELCTMKVFATRNPCFDLMDAAERVSNSEKK